MQDFIQLPDIPRAVTWMILHYPDYDAQSRLIEHLYSLDDVEWAGIAHDKDGKLHHHITCVFPTNWTKANAARHLHVEERWLRGWNSKVKAYQYLVHLNDPEKTQYDLDDIYGPAIDIAQRFCRAKKSASENESMDMLALIKLIHTFPRGCSTAYAIEHIVANGLYSTFRRSGAIGRELLIEHNKGFYAYDE